MSINSIQAGEPSPKDRPAADKARINLERAAILLVDDGLGLDILSHIFFGFGARTLLRCRTVAEAMEVAKAQVLDLVVTEALLADQDGYDFVEALRQKAEYEGNRFVPVILLSAHTASGKVTLARDCGANFFVAKPISPRIIMDRLLWVAREKRQHLQTDHYTGPDRRFHDEPLPAGVDGRRREDRMIASQDSEQAA